MHIFACNAATLTMTLSPRPSLLSQRFTLLNSGALDTRALYYAQNHQTLTARSLCIDTHTALYSEIRSRNQPSCHRTTTQWQGVYASLIITSGQHHLIDGMNEHGLVANVLPESNDERLHTCTTLAIEHLALFLLDTCSSVPGALQALRTSTARALLPVTHEPHRLALSDINGQSALIVLSNQRWYVYNSQNSQLMTPSPVFSDRIKHKEYLGKLYNIVRSSHDAQDTVSNHATCAERDRIATPDQDTYTTDELQNTASMFSVIASTSAPAYASYKSAAHAWLGVADQHNKVFFVENNARNTFTCIPFSSLDLTHTARHLLP